VPEDEVTLRAARVSSRLKSAWRRRDKDPETCMRVLGEWLTGALPEIEGRPLAEDDLRDIFGHDLDWYRIVKEAFSVWLKGAKGDEMQAETPLTWDELNFLREGPSDPLDLAWAIIERKQPRWLMGWRDICRSTDERTVIASVFPKVRTGDTVLLKYPKVDDQRFCAALNGCLCSIVLDYVARQ
jgi:hypothetical protein